MAISLGDNIKLALGLPTDARYYSTATNKPWTGVTEVNARLTGGVGGVRYTGLTVNINGVEYWYCGGIDDSNLVIKNNGSSSLSIYTITGNSTSTGFTIEHNLNKQFVMVQVVENTTPYATIYTDVLRPNANCVCITFDSPPANGIQYKILIIN
jgi:hypothetical protein